MTTRQIQNLLQYLGYDTGIPDGICGRLTRQAVTSFQGDFGGLSVDGDPGPETQEALLQAVTRGMPVREASFWDHIRFWTREEFRCRCGEYHSKPLCGGFPVEPDRTLVELVDDLRAKAGAPGHRSSGIRCRRHNQNSGGVANSRHLSGKALDFFIEGCSGEELLELALADPRTRYAYIISPGQPYVHVDVD